MTLDQLFDFAKEKGIEIDDVPMRALRAVAFPEGWIAMDSRKFKDKTEYKCVLAHEIGHCLTVSFYNIYALASTKRISEHQANRFAAELLVPIDKLRNALLRGITFNRILARMFDVTIDFIDMVLDMFEKEICAAMRNHHARHTDARSDCLEKSYRAGADPDDCGRDCVGGHQRRGPASGGLGDAAGWTVEA